MTQKNTRSLLSSQIIDYMYDPSPMKVYEYYDDYDHLWESNENRPRLQYVALGTDECSKLVVIFYHRECMLACVGSNVHEKAWVVGETDERKVAADIRRATFFEEYQVANVERDIQRHLDNKETMDTERGMPPGRFSISSISYFHLHVRVKSGESYTDKYVARLEQALALLKIRDEFLRKHESLASPPDEKDS
jgi:hypothetical protein